jgi:hypothetical protein
MRLKLSNFPRSKLRMCGDGSHQTLTLIPDTCRANIETLLAMTSKMLLGDFFETRCASSKTAHDLML